MGKVPKPDEIAAVAVVNRVLGTRTVRFDDNTQDGMIDFELACSDQHEPSIALEISSDPDVAATRFFSAWGNRHEAPVSGLTRNWLVEFTTEALVGKGQTELHALLQELEQRGVRRLSIRPGEDGHDWMLGPPGRQHQEDILMLRRLRIDSVWSPDSASEGGYIHPFVQKGWSAEPEAIRTFVEGFLLKEVGRKKLDKLRRAGHLAPHLFLWADSGNMGVTMALRRRRLPTAALHVASHVHGIWVSDYACADTVCHWAPGEGWSFHDVTGAVETALAEAPTPPA